ncbi:MAG: ribonuclease R [Bacillota bacterium]
MSTERKKVLNFLLQEDCRPRTFETLRQALDIKGEKEIAGLYSLLSSLEEEGFISKTEQGRYAPLRGNGMLVGILQGHNRGFAFLLPEAPGEADVFIPPDKTRGALHRDRVVVRLLAARRDGRREGEVVRILERKNNCVVGIYEGSRRRGYIVPDDRRLPHKILINEVKNSVKAVAGDKVLVEITRRQGLTNPYPEGKIVEVIGPADAPGVDITSIQKHFGLPDTFPGQVLQEADKFDGKQIEAQAEAEGRLDLRALPLVTIDGADAKDLDDAVSLERTDGGGYRLGVHIADVSWYVREGSALDREALRRGTSVYLVDRVIPMLPPRLSNDLCSLNPAVPRLAVSVFMELDAGGELIRYEYAPSLIAVRERMTYEAVNRILEGDEKLQRHYAGLVRVFQDMAKLSRLLKEKRLAQGALDFNFPEAKIILDDQGKPLKIEVHRGGQAESIIEEFMLLCNGVIAAHFGRLKVPFLYRVHEQPELDKLYALRGFLSLFNIRLKGDLSLISSQQYQQVLRQVRGTAMEKIVNHVMLRTLPQARYSEAPLGHFGLATRDYTHFTSPIRRYPDLVVHRILRMMLQGKMTAADKRRLITLLPRVARISSEQERNAVEAERATQELKKLEFMQGKEGNEYDGLISGVTSFGFFVELPDTVEGLVHLSMLEGDYFIFDEKRYMLTGQRSGKVYRLGDPIRVRLVRVDWEMRSIHFLPVVGPVQKRYTL